MKLWIKKPSVNRVVYIWKNSVSALGVGTSTLNGRVNPSMTAQDIRSKKDAGKTFIASYISKIEAEPVRLYWIEDNSQKVSGNATELEMNTKISLTQNTFMIYRNEPYTKVKFMDKVFVPHVNKVFGEESVESMIATQAAGDGDLWGRFSRHPVSRKALNNIIEELLWVDQ